MSRPAVPGARRGWAASLSPLPHSPTCAVRPAVTLSARTGSSLSALWCGVPAPWGRELGRVPAASPAVSPAHLSPSAACSRCRALPWGSGCCAPSPRPPHASGPGVSRRQPGRRASSRGHGPPCAPRPRVGRWQRVPTTHFPGTRTHGPRCWPGPRRGDRKGVTGRWGCHTDGEGGQGWRPLLTEKHLGPARSPVGSGGFSSASGCPQTDARCADGSEDLVWPRWVFSGNSGPHAPGWAGSRCAFPSGAHVWLLFACAYFYAL